MNETNKYAPLLYAYSWQPALTDIKLTIPFVS
uniref:Uncharacterized protein n=1 Tax=Anguilla anguilla TaxID=7936 RepID=A0A0E9PCV0_ANGAN